MKSFISWVVVLGCAIAAPEIIEEVKTTNVKLSTAEHIRMQNEYLKTAMEIDSMKKEIDSTQMETQEIKENIIKNKEYLEMVIPGAK